VQLGAVQGGAADHPQRDVDAVPVCLHLVLSEGGEAPMKWLYIGLVAAAVVTYFVVSHYAQKQGRPK